MNYCKFKLTTLSLISCLPVSGAFAFEPISIGDFTVTPQLEMGAAYINNRNQDFGATRSYFDLPVEKNGSRFESYVKPSLGINGPETQYGSFYGGLSVVGSWTWGDADGAGQTRNDPHKTDVDDAFIGWQSGDVFESLGHNAIKLSAGKQQFVIGNGFLIGEGHVDQGHDGDYWIGPRKAFDNTLLAQLDTGKLHVDLFDLAARMDIDVSDYKEKIRVRGGNLEWRDPDYGTLGATVYHAMDADNPTRDGINVYDVRASGTPFQSVKQLALAAEYAWQRGGDTDKRSEAWYLQGAYTFDSLPWAPILTYRHAVFSDDYDPLLYGYGGDWGTWFHGEIVGESMLFNANQKIDMLKLTVYPTQALSTGIIGYDFSYDKAPAGVTSKSFAKEINLYADLALTDHVSVGALYGIAQPDKGAKQTFGDDNTSNLIETYVTLKF